MEELDPVELEKAAIAQIRRNRQLTVEQILRQHEEALRSVLQCMSDAEAAEAAEAAELRSRDGD
jgi:enoyl-CoA hydratase/carnithine racemase